MKINIISKFIYKLFILTCILLLSVVLDKYELINLKTIKHHLNENINFVNITKAVNGSINIIDLGDNVIDVSLNDSKSKIIDENKYLYEQKYCQNGDKCIKYKDKESPLPGVFR